jgi:hypothetical protein
MDVSPVVDTRVHLGPDDMILQLRQVYMHEKSQILTLLLLARIN